MWYIDIVAIYTSYYIAISMVYPMPASYSVWDRIIKALCALGYNYTWLVRCYIPFKDTGENAILFY